MIDVFHLPPSEVGEVVQLPWVRKYPSIVKMMVCWPFQITHEGLVYTQTGKHGTRFADGCPSAEYARDEGARVWLGLDGQVKIE